MSNETVIQSKSSNSKQLLPWVLWFLAASFFSFQFVLRLCPGLIMPQIMEKFRITASSYGVLSSMYYFGYAIAQIPMALLLDRYGPKKVISICAFISAISTLVFVYTASWPLLLISRFTIGVVSAAGFLGVSKVASSWFSRERYGAMLGFSLTIGLAGAVYGGKPVALLMSVYGWEKVMQFIAFTGLALAGIFFLGLRNSGPYNVSEEPLKLSDLRSLFKYRILIVLGLANLLMVGPLEGFADVWGVSFLMKSQLLDRDTAALMCSMIFTGMLIGGPILAAIANRWKIHLEATAGCGIIMAGLFAIVLRTDIAIPNLVLYASFLMIGIMCCYQILILEVGTNSVPVQLMGVSVAFLNSINMLGGSFFHSSIGWLLDTSSKVIVENGMRIYEAQDYAHALWIIPIACLVGSVALVAIRRTYGATHSYMAPAVASKEPLAST